MEPEISSCLCFSPASTLRTSPMHLYFDCVRLVFVLLTCIVTTQRSLALCPQRVFKGNYGAIQSRHPPPPFCLLI